MEYIGHVIRPPSEAESLIIQVTTGCSHNACRFCGAYPQSFTIRKIPDIEKDLDWCSNHYGPRVRRLFLADGNALVRKTSDLLAIMTMARERFPKLRRVACYANAGDLRNKSDEELASLRAAGLSIAYVGLESGDDKLLERMNKGASSGDIVEAVKRLQAADIRCSIMALLGLAGDQEAASLRHARRTAEACNAMQPRFLSLLTVMLVPGTPLYDDERRGDFSLPDTRSILLELRELVSHLQTEGCIFRSNHASNYLPLAGTLPKDKERLLEDIDQAIDGKRSLVPEFFRGL